MGRRDTHAKNFEVSNRQLQDRGLRVFGAGGWAGGTEGATWQRKGELGGREARQREGVERRIPIWEVGQGLAEGMGSS